MVEGLVRSLSKELAGRGGVMNMVNVMNESEGNIAACEFFTSGKSAFINGQRVNVQQPDEESLKFYESRARGTAVVTGAARGIGFETAKEMLSLGFDIYGVDHPAGDFGALESLGVKVRWGGKLERSDSSIPPITITNNHFRARALLLVASLFAPLIAGGPQAGCHR